MTRIIAVSVLCIALLFASAAIARAWELVTL